MKQKRILVIDDEAAITRTIKVNLERTGHYAVRTETTASRALAAAQEFTPDLIFLDVMMPEMDGGEVAAEIKSDSRLRDIPIIFLTAIVSKKEAGEETIQRGGQKFIAKPINLHALIKCLEENTGGTVGPET